MRRRRRRTRLAIPPPHPALRLPAALLVPATPFIAAALTGTSTPQAQVIERPGVHYCAKFRWNVKTLTDPDAGKIDPTLKDTTVHDLVHLPYAQHVPKDLPRAGGPTFTPVELTTYRIHVKLKRWKISADDGDIHLVVHDPATEESMIVEFPDPKCTVKASDAQRKEMTDARLAIESSCPGNTLRKSFHELAGEATITGVGFFDKNHGQNGVAVPNAIELHPALSFAGADCKAAPKQ
jgi:hypothetical protein